MASSNLCWWGSSFSLLSYRRSGSCSNIVCWFSEVDISNKKYVKLCEIVKLRVIYVASRASKRIRWCSVCVSAIVQSTGWGRRSKCNWHSFATDLVLFSCYYLWSLSPIGLDPLFSLFPVVCCLHINRHTPISTQHSLPAAVFHFHGFCCN